MKNHAILPVSLFLVLVFCAATAAKDAKSQDEITKITCKADPSQSYACFLPKKFSKSKKYNILYCFSPDGNGEIIVKLYTAACEKHGWIAVGSMNAKNGPSEPIRAAMEAMWHDTHERFKINEQGCYATGFSGGSGMSFWMAEAHPDNVSGVIPLAVASTWAQGELDLPKHVSVFFIIGDKDAVPYVQKHVQSLRAKGNSAEMKTFSGGHQLPPATHTAAAIDWLQMIATEKIPLEMAENAEKLIAEKSPYEAREIYNEIVKKYPKSESAKKAKDKMKAMDADQSLSDELKAGALLAQGADAQKKGKIDDALKLFRQVETDYPKTEYVKRAKARADELEAEKLLKQAEELEGKGDKAAAGEIYKQILEKFPSTKSAEKAKEKAPK